MCVCVCGDVKLCIIYYKAYNHSPQHETFKVFIVFTLFTDISGLANLSQEIMISYCPADDDDDDDDG